MIILVRPNGLLWVSRFQERSWTTSPLNAECGKNRCSAERHARKLPSGSSMNLDRAIDHGLVVSCMLSRLVGVLGGECVPRRPEVFVRPVSMTEGQRLQKISQSSKDPVKLRRVIVVRVSAQGQFVPDIAHLLDVSPDYVRGVIHAFNEQGFAALEPKWSGDAPKTIDGPTRARICAIAGCDPRTLRQPFSTWSLPKLCDYLVEQRYVERISRETLRRILRDGGVSWQTTTWKASNDADFTAKMTRILDLYDHPPSDGRVLCVDEFGPLNLLPRKGKAWRACKALRRLRATCTRTQGVRHMLAALDLTTGKITYRIWERKRWRNHRARPKQDSAINSKMKTRLPGQRRLTSH